MKVLDWVFLVLAVLIIIITLMQGGKSDGASSSIMGGMASSHSFVTLKERGPEKVLSKITFVMAGLFFFLAIAVRVLV